MSDLAISIRDLQKVYRRYSTNGWRALGLLGLPTPQGCYDEFWALDGVNLDIRRGERVALVGRNGAGKSTLLRHVSGELTPTGGTVHINGSVKALFGLGEGFHPEFSGMDNIRSALALHGVPSREAARAIDDIVDFSELEEFIHRPLKEYSAGMYARLAFATATARTPDILIIDEILGAGDAYFLGKCLQRINAITSHGATVLFVSHDMGSALMLCQRGVWIHQGKLRADGDMVAIAKLYQAHIREEQEAALHARAMRLTRRAAQVEDRLLFRLIGEGDAAPAHPIHVARVSVGVHDQVLAEALPGGQDDAGDIDIIIDSKMNWGKGAKFKGRLCRPFADYGGAFVHAPFSVAGRILSDDSWLELDVAPSRDSRILLQRWDRTAGDGGQYVDLAVIEPDHAESWRQLRVQLPITETEGITSPLGEGAGDEENAPAEILIGDTNSEALTVEGTSVLSEKPGRSRAVLRDFHFADSEGRRRRTLVSGEPLEAVFEVEVQDDLPRTPIGVVAIYRPDGTVISQLISPQNEQDSRIPASSRLTMRMSIDELLIGPGDFIASAAIFRELDPSRPPEDGAYDLHDRRYPLKIVEATHEPFPLGLVRQRARWESVVTLGDVLDRSQKGRKSRP